MYDRYCYVSLRWLVVLCSSLFICWTLSPSRTYWVAFSDFPDPNHISPGFAKYMMKIDDAGRLVAGPGKVQGRQILHVGSFGPGIAISRGSQRYLLNMWTVCSGVNAGVFKTIVNTNRVRKVRLLSTSLITSDPAMVVATHKPSNNFLGLQIVNETGHAEFIGVGLTSQGAISGDRWSLTDGRPACLDSFEGCAWGLSSDGRVLFYQILTDGPKVMLQSLGSRGRPVGRPVSRTIDQFPVPLDISNILAGGVRYLLYDVTHEQVSTLFVQKMESKTLRNIDAPIPVAVSNIPGQQAAMSPDGRFLLYWSPGNGLVFQGLDAIGHPSGAPRYLGFHRFVSGLDIFAEN
jgi:hypothetical protein